MKKLLVTLLVCCVVFVGCKKQDEKAKGEKDGKKKTEKMTGEKAKEKAQDTALDTDVKGTAALTMEGAVDKYMTLMEQIPDVLATIKDDASADAAIKKLDGIVKKMNETMEAGQKLGEPSAELKAKMEDRVDKMVEKLQKQMMRIAQDPALQKHMKPISEVMQKMKKPGAAE